MAHPTEHPTVGPRLPSMPHPPLSQTQRAAQPDAFVSMIQGASIPVKVGAGTSSCTFILPVGLLCHHSIFFQNQFVYLNGVCMSHDANKKRKLSEAQDEEDGGSIRSQSGGKLKANARAEVATGEKVAEEYAKKPEMIIRLPDVDTAIFGLFLAFIYKDAYPENVDAIIRPGPVYPPSAQPQSSFTPIAPPQYPAVNNVSAGKSPNALRMPSGPATSKQQGTPTGTARQTPFHNTGISNGTAPPKLSNMSPYGPYPPAGPRPSTSSMTVSAPHSNQSIITPPAPIPYSIHAYLLAHRLSACAFMNYTTTRLYMAIGRHFALTPNLVAYIWRQTQSFPPGCPLRRLTLDFLVAFWSHPDPATHHGVIQRRGDWDALFDVHKRLRNDFIKGLQGGVRVLAVERYYATLAVGRREGVRAGGVKEEGAAKKEGDGIAKEGDAIAKDSEGVVKERCTPPLAITEGGAVTKAVGGVAESGDKNTMDGNGGPDECNTVVVKVENE